MRFTYHTKGRIHGFSLVEVLVYIAVLLTAVMAVVSLFISLRDVFERNRVKREITDAATEILERIGRETRYAVDVDMGSALGTTTGILVLDQGATSTRFALEGTDVVFEQNGVTFGALDSAEILVTSLVFTEYENTGTSTALRVALTLGSDSRYASSTETFYTTAVLRGSYDQ